MKWTWPEDRNNLGIRQCGDALNSGYLYCERPEGHRGPHACEVNHWGAKRQIMWRLKPPVKPLSASEVGKQVILGRP